MKRILIKEMNSMDENGENINTLLIPENINEGENENE